MRSQDNTLFVTTAKYLRGRDFIGRRNSSINAAQVSYFNADNRFDRWGGELDQLASGGWLEFRQSGLIRIGGIVGSTATRAPTSTPRYTTAIGSGYRLLQQIASAAPCVLSANAPGGFVHARVELPVRAGALRAVCDSARLFDRQLQLPEVASYTPTQVVNGGHRFNVLAGIRFRL